MKFQIISNFLRDSRVKPLANCLLSKRWTATASLEFDAKELASAKPFEDIPSMLSLPKVGTMWVYLPIIGNVKFITFIMCYLH